jgi:hypothetical protein
MSRQTSVELKVIRLEMNSIQSATISCSPISNKNKNWLLIQKKSNFQYIQLNMIIQVHIHFLPTDYNHQVRLTHSKPVQVFYVVRNVKVMMLQSATNNHRSLKMPNR